MENAQQVVLSAQGITKDYATRVLDNVDFQVHAGEIHGLLGANGAGKSTLCKIISGLVLPTAGTMTLGGQTYQPRTKQQAEAAGVQIVQQELNLIPTLDVAHNLFFSRLPHRWGIISQTTLTAQALRLLAEFGLDEVSPTTLVRTLGVGQQQMIEIASVLNRSCQLLILDEPTAALSPAETSLLVEHLRTAKARGLAIVVISHRLDEMQAWTDRITILRDGKLVGTYRTRELNQAAMVQGMTTGDVHHRPADDAPLGAEVATQGAAEGAAEVVGAGQAEQANPLFSVAQLRRGSALKDISFSVAAGEILGIGGLVGSGRTELLRCLFGADQADAGTITLAGVSRPPFRSTVEAVRHGLAMVSEDRKADGLLLTQSITDNIMVSSLHGYRPADVAAEVRSRAGLYRPRAADSIAREQQEQLKIHCRDVQQLAGTLSGGNQQKVVLAKWMVRGGSVFLFDEPTRGIDVAARQQIYELIEALATDGKAIILVSSDLEELMQLAHRIGVLSNGRWVREFSSAPFDRVALVEAMFAGYRNRRAVMPV